MVVVFPIFATMASNAIQATSADESKASSEIISEKELYSNNNDP